MAKKLGRGCVLRKADGEQRGRRAQACRALLEGSNQERLDVNGITDGNLTERLALLH